MAKIIPGKLWMGELEPYMDENFILTAIRKMGHHPVSVEFGRNKYKRSELAGFCIITFESDEKCKAAGVEMSDTPIPGTSPAKKFSVDLAVDNDAPIEKEHDIWVGLDTTVDNASLYKVFASRYASVRSANVMFDRISGRSKGHAFVRFGHQFEPNKAIRAINGYVGLGEFPLNVKEAVRRSEETLEPYMTENFILNAFRKMGEDPQAVKLMKNKYTGEAAGYCFVNFMSDEQAIDAMHKLNGKPIPGTNPVVRFRLNSASNNVNQNRVLGPTEREYSVWVGDLSPEVDDYSLYKVFAIKYNSIRSAKVILDGNGFSKGYGFVRFGALDEQSAALYEMSGYVGLGTKPLKICNAVPKPKGDQPMEPPVSATTIVQNAFAAAAAAANPDYSQYYDPSTAYWQNYSSYYYDQQQGGGAGGPQAGSASGYYQQQQQQQVGGQWASMYPPEDDDMALVEHKRELDVDAFNREAIDSDRNLYDALESSKWLPIEQLEAF